jgi:lipopolysaccharide/colanic/teichoic acid biosynthesis glycosyltransferase
MAIAKAVTSHECQRVLPQSGLPRSAEVPLALLALIIAAPVLLIIAIAIALDSRGPIIFRQQRKGRGATNFVLYKFRTMVYGSEGPQITSSGDERITRVGLFLRRTKLDELPEMWNVLRGDMSLVGPRPEVPRYVDLTNHMWQEVLRVRPGLTHPVTLKLRDEEKLLALLPGDYEHRYSEVLLPYKLKGYLAYENERTSHRDIEVLWRTFLVVILSTARRVVVWDEVYRESADTKLSAHQDKDTKFG